MIRLSGPPCFLHLLSFLPFFPFSPFPCFLLAYTNVLQIYTLKTIMTQALNQNQTYAASLNFPNSCCSLTIHFCNIRGLISNLNSVHHHLETEQPYFLFLSETQIVTPLDS